MHRLMTMAAAAQSQQVGFEACLLAAQLKEDGTFEDIKWLTRSWATALVSTVGPQATRLQTPTILAHQASGQAFLIMLMLRMRALLFFLSQSMLQVITGRLRFEISWS